MLCPINCNDDNVFKYKKRPQLIDTYTQSINMNKYVQFSQYNYMQEVHVYIKLIIQQPDDSSSSSASFNQSTFDLVLGQVKKLRELLRSYEFRTLGYQLKVFIKKVDLRDISHINSDNSFLNACYREKRDAFTYDRLNLIIFASNHSYLYPDRLGLSDLHGCLIYLYKKDKCSIILLHEVLHSIFELQHSYTIYNNSCPVRKPNIMKPSYSDEVCTILKNNHNLFGTGLTCNMGRDFTKTKYSTKYYKQYHEHDLKKIDETNEDGDDYDEKVEKFSSSLIVSNRPMKHNETKYIKKAIRNFNRNEFRREQGNMSKWSDWTIMANSFYSIHERKRMCDNGHSICNPKHNINEIQLKINDKFQGYVDRDENDVNDDQQFVNCKNLSHVYPCLKVCSGPEYDDNVIHMLPDGTPCTLARDKHSYGLCIRGTCNLLTNASTLYTTSFEYDKTKIMSKDYDNVDVYSEMYEFALKHEYNSYRKSIKYYEDMLNLDSNLPPDAPKRIRFDKKLYSKEKTQVAECFGTNSCRLLHDFFTINNIDYRKVKRVKMPIGTFPRNIYTNRLFSRDQSVTPYHRALADSYNLNINVHQCFLIT